ncbi:maleylacetoacetate isomerase [Chitinasiproducens palmae]|uniref:Maleylacetoacetate isomerase n=1 Tax=Chitinasiproducens palmae TaxID=1770053 RepID=A0A1H2PTH3_9BURK|nr:maleylacetoacetate isomerase [Chitinasiproducens palmae]SDV50397.1 maleylacetoacetate isomerase [Chitinasiproducens palmae]
MRLYTYFRSSAAYRVRIALNLKGLDYEAVPVHLVRGGGEQLQDAYRALNPDCLLPTLVDGDTLITQSLAIIEYLEERHPSPALLPGDAAQRALIRSLSQAIASEIHAVDNLRVLKYLQTTLGVDDAGKSAWYRHWIELGFAAFEKRLAERDSRFCVGDTPTLADCCLIPQVFNARRFKIDLTPYPRIVAVDAQCATLDAFQRAAPGAQPDAE